MSLTLEECDYVIKYVLCQRRDKAKDVGRAERYGIFLTWLGCAATSIYTAECRVDGRGLKKYCDGSSDVTDG